MLNLRFLDNDFLIMGLLVPGIIVLFIRSCFVTGQSPTSSEALISYFAVSSVYHAFSLPVVGFLLSMSAHGDNLGACAVETS